MSSPKFLPPTTGCYPIAESPAQQTRAHAGRRHLGSAGQGMLGTAVMPWILDSSLQFIDIKLSVSREVLGFIAVRFSCYELIDSIGLSGLHPTQTSRGPPRAGRPITPYRSKWLGALGGRGWLPRRAVGSRLKVMLGHRRQPKPQVDARSACRRRARVCRPGPWQRAGRNSGRGDGGLQAAFCTAGQPKARH